jgi:tRNA(Ile)-lysidine synthase
MMAGNGLSDHDFSRLMAGVGPFEQSPHVAVAVSGGADSLALCLLASRWAAARQGRVSALTVDHGLRPESADEAARVGPLLADMGVEHHVLTWDGAKPTSGVQAAARAARYDLMTQWARRAGVLHVLLAHHQDDQAETVLLRLAAGSGVDGLSAMAAVVETPAVRLLRPLLGVPGARLKALLTGEERLWIEDPSNRDDRYARVRLRRVAPSLARAGLPAERLAATARSLARSRMAMEEGVSALLARCCTVFPAGYAIVDPAILAREADEVSGRALARILLCIGGRAHGPRSEKLDRLHARLKGGEITSATLGGCRILLRGRHLLVCREGRGKAHPMDVTPATRIVWDNRFLIEFTWNGATPVFLSRLGRDGWAEVVSDRPELRGHAIPAAARMTLPAFRDRLGVVAVPHLGYSRRGPGGKGDDMALKIGRIAFSPPNSLSGVGFRLA